MFLLSSAVGSQQAFHEAGFDAFSVGLGRFQGGGGVICGCVRM